jgi:excisionase family DNA binding protein
VAQDLLTAAQAAERLGVTVTTLYDWLGRSRIGELEIRGQRVTINFFQGGARGQGRIRLEVGEVERLRELMRVRSQAVVVRRLPVQQTQWPGIYVTPGRPR